MHSWQLLAKFAGIKIPKMATMIMICHMIVTWYFCPIAQTYKAHNYVDLAGGAGATDRRASERLPAQNK